jgi:hypothetical protein
LGSTVIGSANIENFILNGGEDLKIQGMFNKAMLQKDPSVLGNLLTSLFGKSTSTSALSLRGINATIEGTEVSWLREAVEFISFPLISIESSSKNNAVESFDLGLSLAVDDIIPTVKNGIITSGILLPINFTESHTFNFEVSYIVFLSTEKGEEFARFNTGFLPTAAKNGTIAVGFKKANLSVTNERQWVDSFLKPLLSKSEFAVQMGGNIALAANTSLGNASLPDISFQSIPWKLKGYSGFQGANLSLSSPEVEKIDNTALRMKLKMKLMGSGDIQLAVCSSCICRRFKKLLH